MPTFTWNFDMGHKGPSMRLYMPLTKGQDGGPTPKIIVAQDGQAKVEGGLTVEIPLDKVDFASCK